MKVFYFIVIFGILNFLGGPTSIAIVDDPTHSAEEMVIITKAYKLGCQRGLMFYDHSPFNVQCLLNAINMGLNESLSVKDGTEIVCRSLHSSEAIQECKKEVNSLLNDF